MIKNEYSVVGLGEGKRHVIKSRVMEYMSGGTINVTKEYVFPVGLKVKSIISRRITQCSRMDTEPSGWDRSR